MRPPPYRYTLPALVLSLILLVVVLSISPKGKAGDGTKPKQAGDLQKGPITFVTRDPSSASLRVVAIPGPTIPGQVHFTIQVELWRGGKIDLEPWETEVWARVDIYDPDDVQCQGEPLLTDYSNPAKMVAGEVYREDIPYWTELAPTESPYPVIVRIVNLRPDGSEVTASMQRLTCQIPR